MIRRIATLLPLLLPLGLGCASPTPALFAMNVPPAKAYAGPPRARDRVAVILIESASPRGREELELIELRVDAIDDGEVDRGPGYALLPGLHRLRLSGRLRVGAVSFQDFAAPLDLDARANGLYGISAEDSGCPSGRCIVARDLDEKRAVAVVDMRFAGPPRCGLGFELVLLLPPFLWRRRARRARPPAGSEPRCRAKGRARPDPSGAIAPVKGRPTSGPRWRARA
jgi:hypothetical protein